MYLQTIVESADVVALGLAVPLYDLVENAIDSKGGCLFADLEISRVEPSAAVNWLFAAAASDSSIEYEKRLVNA